MIQANQQPGEAAFLTKAAGKKKRHFREYAGFAVYTIFLHSRSFREKLQETEMENLFHRDRDASDQVLHEMEKKG